MIRIEKEELERIQQIEDNYKRAYELVKILFKEKKDKEGEPYIGHLERVSQKLKKENTRIAGLLHDVVEDIEGFTLDDLRDLHFNEEIIELVRIVTKESSNGQKKTYHERITSILNTHNIEAIKLKYADMLDNIDEERLSKLDEETRNRLFEKYSKEIIRLENVLKERGENI